MFSRLCSIVSNPDCYIGPTTDIPYTTWKDALSHICSKYVPWSQEASYTMDGTGTYEVAWCYGDDEAHLYSYCEVDHKNKTFSMLFKNGTPTDYETDRLARGDVFWKVLGYSTWTAPNSNVAVFRKSFTGMTLNKPNYDLCIVSYNGHSMVFLFELIRNASNTLTVRFKKLFLNIGNTDKSYESILSYYTELMVEKTSRTFTFEPGIENMYHVTSNDYSTCIPITGKIENWNSVESIRNYMIALSKVYDYEKNVSGNVTVTGEMTNSDFGVICQAYNDTSNRATIEVFKYNAPYHFECDDIQYFNVWMQESDPRTAFCQKIQVITARPYFVLFKNGDYVLSAIGSLKRTSKTYCNMTFVWRVFYAPDIVLDNDMIATDNLSKVPLLVSGSNKTIISTIPTVSLS